MKYKFKNEGEIERAIAYLKFLKLLEADVKIEKIRRLTTRPQQNYLHLLLSWFGLEFGYDVETVKYEFFKKMNADLFYTKIAGTLGEYQRIKSCNELDTKEMTIAIDRFRDWSSQEHGFYLPSPNEEDLLVHIENEVEKTDNQRFL